MDSAANRRSLVSRRFPRRPCPLGRRLFGRSSRRLTAPAAKEQARLRTHFREVLAELRARDVNHLPGPQKDARSRLLGELARYARVGRFPKNLDFPGARVPYFIDAFGTRCAMAHLIESTGETALVARVAATMNNALVRELEGDPGLRRWLEQAGLTAAEAARIQPSYCFMTKAEGCLCNQAFQISAVVEATLTTPLMAGEVTVRIDVVHGDMSIAMPGQEVMLYNKHSRGRRRGADRRRQKLERCDDVQLPPQAEPRWHARGQLQSFPDKKRCNRRAPRGGKRHERPRGVQQPSRGARRAVERIDMRE
jgi:hypothetical protein